MEPHEHNNTVHGLKDLLLAQNGDVHVLVIKKLVAKESIDNEISHDNARFRVIYYKQNKNLLLINTNGVLCVRYPKSQRNLHASSCMIVMPQLF